MLEKRPTTLPSSFICFHMEPTVLIILGLLHFAFIAYL